MTQLKVDLIVDRNATGAPNVSLGATIPTGATLTGAGGMSVTGVCTAATFSGEGSGLNNFTNSSKGYAIKLIIDPLPFRS